jgi:hypothetical protein
MNRQVEPFSNDDSFLTYDIGLSSALLTLDFQLLSLNRDNPRKIGFLFARTAKLEDEAQNYFDGRLMVDARSLFENTKMLKNRIYSSAI